MDTETREMFGKVMGMLEGIVADIQGVKTENQDIKADMQGMKAEIQADMQGMKAEMVGFARRQDEMYLILKGWEENRQISRSIEENSLIMRAEIDSLKVSNATVVGALRRSSRELWKDLSGETDMAKAE